MTERRRAWMSWSSGKDSAFALHEARRDPSLEVVGLLTTVTAAFDRVSMHGVRRALLEAQSDRLGLPLHVAEIPAPCPNEVYEARMGGLIERARAEGVSAMVFGDLFLDDIRAYRERMLDGTGIEPVFPLWQRPTARLARTMLEAGVRAHLTCLDPGKIPAELAGRVWDADLLAALPAGVDPCGEHGEFHTFVSDGPGFASPIGVEPGEVVRRDGFVFADLLPTDGAKSAT